MNDDKELIEAATKAAVPTPPTTKTGELLWAEGRSDAAFYICAMKGQNNEQ